MRAIFAVTFAIFLSACASSPYTYHVEPTPIKKQNTAYAISAVNVNLTLGKGAIPGDESFVDEAELQKQFSSYLSSALAEKGILAQEGSEHFEVIINIDYTRKFNIGGKALNKPEVSHWVTILNAEETLATFSQGPYTTKYAYLTNAAVDMQIATFLWGREDEPKDVKLISKIIVEDLANAGK